MTRLLSIKPCHGAGGDESDGPIFNSQTFDVAKMDIIGDHHTLVNEGDGRDPDVVGFDSATGAVQSSKDGCELLRDARVDGQHFGAFTHDMFIEPPKLLLSATRSGQLHARKQLRLSNDGHVQDGVIRQAAQAGYDARMAPLKVTPVVRIEQVPHGL